MQVGKGDGRSLAAAARVPMIAMLVVGLATACAGGEQTARLDPSDTLTPATQTTTAVATTEVSSTIPMGPLNVGEAARVGDLEVTVRQIRLADAINSGIQRGLFLLVDVAIRNVGSGDESYGPTDWRVVLEDGTAVESEVYADAGKFAFGILGPGESADGALAFALPGSAPSKVVYARSGAPDQTATWAVTPTPTPGA